MIPIPHPQLLLVAGALLPVVGATALVSYLFRHRGKPGANWFMISLAAVAVFCGSYGLSLLVFDPGVRVAFEMVTIVAVCCIGPPFLAFGLEYTGRPDIVRNPLFGAVFAVPVLTVPVAATNASHGLLWSGFELTPLFGAATVQYTLGPWGFFAAIFSLGTAGLGALLLVGAILKYGPLYRREATAVVLSTIPPSVGGLLWLFGVGPVPQLNLAPVLMIPHLAFDAYAFVGTHMFETNPTTQRAAERSALDDLSDPLLVLDPNEQVVNLNGRATALFGVSAPEDLPISLEALTDVDLDGMRTAGELRVGGSEGGTYAVSYTPLSDTRADPVGSMVVLYDITEARRRDQQLAVLNRVLRHNLRNEMTVIRGYADGLSAELEEQTLAAQAETIVEASDRLLSIGEKVRTFDRIQEGKLRRRELSVVALLDDIERELRDEHPEATVERDIPAPDFEVRSDPDVLALILSNLVGNAVEHAEEGTDPAVEVRARGAAANEAVFEVRDGNPQIPEIETASLEAGDETQLQHGRGIGLWIVSWCVAVLNGEIRFRYDDGNVVTVVLPDSYVGS